MVEDEYKNYHEENKIVNGENTILEPYKRKLEQPNFPIPELQENFQKQYDLITEFQKTTDHKKIKEIYDEFLDLQKQHVDVILNMDHSKLSPDQNNQKIYFSAYVGYIIGSGIFEVEE